VHCANHSLDLALQEVGQEVSLVADALQFIKDVSNVIRESSKRKDLYESLFGKEEAVLNMVSICPTRWCVRYSAVKRVLTVYDKLLETLKVLVEDKSVRTNSQARISGLLKQAQSAKTYFGVLVCVDIFWPCEDLAKAFKEIVSLLTGHWKPRCFLLTDCLPRETKPTRVVWCNNVTFSAQLLD